MKNNTNVRVSLFDKADYGAINDYLMSADWSFVDVLEDMDAVTDRLYDILYTAINNFVPCKTITESRFPSWYSPELKRLINKKKRLYHTYRRSGLREDYERYSVVRRESKIQIDFCYLMFVSRVELMIPNNIKHFWSFVNNLRQANSLPLTMQFKNRQLDTPQDIVAAFAEHFESCYSDHSYVACPDTSFLTEVVHLQFHTFTCSEVENKINSLDSSKGAGPDGISPLFIKKCMSALTPHLRDIYQKSFNTGVFPSKWKQSTLFPIFKSGDRDLVENYRGISLLCTLGKIFESIITDDLFNEFKTFISIEQHGFFQGRSTITNLAVYQDFLVRSVESGHQVDSIYTDLAKAFDSVCHELLVRKLECLGVGGPYLTWLRSYLSSRSQCVKLFGVSSAEISVTSGVPQGSHLGPILFLLFVNDIVNNFNFCRCLLYADDLKFFATVSSLSECRQVQYELNSLVDWCNCNFLKLNVKKCKVMRFFKLNSPVIYSYNIDNLKLEEVILINDLGIIFDKYLSFNMHIDNIVVKSFRMLGFIKRNCRHIEDTKAILTLYNSLVRSILEYGPVIWAPTYQCHIDRLERVQAKFVKFLLYKYRFPYENVSHEIRLLLVGLSSLETRRRNSYLFFLYKLIKGSIDCESLLSKLNFRIPGRHTRLLQLFIVAPHRTNYGFRAFTDRLTNNYNLHFSNVDIFCNSLASLKRSFR